MQNKGFDYYAFISYNHKDAKWARQLQRQLEHYRLPSALCREQPDLPKRITPVFLDSSDLVARSSLLNSLRAKLDASNYLIVLCSPNSAASPWVNDEVEYFINTGRKDQIIPLIIDGEPHAADPAGECYPPALANLSSHEELLGISAKAYGRRGAFLRIIATLLDLKLDRVITRDAAVRRRRFALYASALLFAVEAAFSLVWYNVPHTAYYIDYTYMWEKPIGLQKVSSDRRRQMDYTYRFTTLRGDVVQVERVNSAGTLTTATLLLGWEDPPSMQFYYGTSDDFDGRTVTRVACCDIYGQELYEKHYSADLRAVDFVQSGDNSTSFSLGTNLLSSQAAVGAYGSNDNRGDVIRYIQTYDDNGRLIRRMFKRDNRGSSGGTPTRDENGVWGIDYRRDDLGRIIGIRLLDQDGNFMADSAGGAGCDCTYGESGRISGETCLDLSGSPTADENNVVRTVVEYDDLDRVVELAYFDADGERVIRRSDGISVYRYEYDDRGFMISWEVYDHTLEPCYDSLGTFRIVATVDDNGRDVRWDAYSPDGELRPCTAGYASVTRTYAPNGQMTRECYFGADGSPTPNLSLNVYEINYTFTDGLPTRIDYVDSQGSPMRSNEGIATVCREYNDERQLSRAWYLDENGEPVRLIGGYAEMRLSYTDGNCTRTDFYDEAGAPCWDNSGVTSYVNTFETGQLTSQSCLGPEGEPVLNAQGWHRIDKSFDEGGLLLRECYYGTQGERVIADVGYSAVSYTYDAAGRMAGETYYNAEDQERSPLGNFSTYYGATRIQYEYDQRGNLARTEYISRTNISASGSVWDVVRTYDDYGNTTSECWRDAQGVPVLNSSGYASAEADYDAFGRIVETRRYDVAGALIDRQSLVYDSHGRRIRITTYEPDGSVRIVENNEYDEFGNCTLRSYTDGDGQLCMSTAGFAMERCDYDASGNLTDFRLYDETGSPCDDIFHNVYTYTVTGKTLTEAHYDAEEQLIERIERTFDSYDRLIETRLYGADGSCSGWVVYTYSPSGYVAESCYYNGDGSLMDSKCSGFSISEVYKDTPAAEVLLQTGDIFIVYNLWSFSSMLTDPNASFDQFSEELQGGLEAEKHIVVARYNEDRTVMKFIEVTLPAGAAGFRVKGDVVYSSQVKDIVDAYEQWLEDGAQSYDTFQGIG